MIIKCWRIFHTKHANNPASGEGARITGGRWNSKGKELVYTAESLDLAITEARLPISVLRRTYDYVEITFDDALLTELPQKGYPADWDKTPAAQETRRIGDEWVENQSSAVLKVKSRHGGFNYLLNPAHPDAIKIKYARPAHFSDIEPMP